MRNLFHVLGIQYYGACMYRGIDRAGERHPTAIQEIKTRIFEFVHK